MRLISDRADRFLHRVDRHLPSLPDVGARRRWLGEQIDTWEQLYAQFIATKGESGPPGSHVNDYLLTITGLAARLEALKDEPIRGLCGLLAEAGAAS